jgi:type II secretory pathway component GspD/PulD (secretin)
MATKYLHSMDRRWSCSVLLGLLVALTTWTSAWPLKPLGARSPVVVHEGQLSVELREAQVRDVLAAIGQQAGLRVHVDASANRTVNAQFTDMELDQGLRRLLRAASLSYTLLYARGPASTVILQEVRVFGEARGEAPASHDRTPTERAQRAAALLAPRPQEERAEPEPEAEPEQEVEAGPEEPEQDGDDAED